MLASAKPCACCSALQCPLHRKWLLTLRCAGLCNNGTTTQHVIRRAACTCSSGMGHSRTLYVHCSHQGREEIQEDDLFTALEKIQQERLGGSMNSSQSTDETVRTARDRSLTAVLSCSMDRPAHSTDARLPEMRGLQGIHTIQEFLTKAQRSSSLTSNARTDQRCGCGMQVVPAQLRRNIAVYEAARSLLGYITPDFDEVAKVRLAKRPAVQNLHALCSASQVGQPAAAACVAFAGVRWEGRLLSARGGCCWVEGADNAVILKGCDHTKSLVAQVVACPGGVAVGHTYFIPSEEHLESGITTRAFMEAKLVVCLAGRCAESGACRALGPAFDAAGLWQDRAGLERGLCALAVCVILPAYVLTSLPWWTATPFCWSSRHQSTCRPPCCRVGERLVLGDANVSTMGAGDLNAANRCAREMVYRCGFSAKLGPVSLMDQEEVYLGQGDRCGFHKNTQGTGWR